MLILLPPSETKATGGGGGPLDLDRLSFPELNRVREWLAGAIVGLADDVPASLRALELSERQDNLVRHNAELWKSPTLPALNRYTGVLYDALDVAGLTKAESARAQARLAVSSALFGLLRATDPVPAYRLSAGNVLPGMGSLRSVWRPALEPVLSAVDDLVIDLRSGAYAELARIPGAVEVRVLSEDGSGRRKAVSHFNKAHKGRLARALVKTRKEPADLKQVIRAAKTAGLRIEPSGERILDLVVAA